MADASTAEGRVRIESFFHDYVGEACEGQPGLLEAEGYEFTDVSVISPEMMRAVSLVNAASVRDSADRYDRPLDALRFRAHIHIDGVKEWAELDWIGREITIGSALFRGVLRIKRCAAVDVDPRTGARGINLLKALMKTCGHPDCGVYLEGLRSGTLTVGDTFDLPA